MTSGYQYHSEQFDRAAVSLRPIFERAAAGAIEREQKRELPRAQIRELAAAGFGRLRIPVESGGFGLTIPEVVRLLVELGAADANLPQIFRGHLAFVEDRLQAPSSPERDAWLERFVDGGLVGNAWSESGAVALGGSNTVVSQREGTLVLNGRKFYTTGSIFANWTDVTATHEDGSSVTVLVRTDSPGLTISNDWDGFGQQLTGTGTIVFDNVELDPVNVFRFEDRFAYQTALYQLTLLSVQAGIAKAVLRDATAEVRARTRVYSHGLAPLAKDDGQILAVIGQISSIAFTAEAAVDRVAQAIQAAADLEHQRGTDAHRQANVQAEIAADQAQVVLSELVPKSATLLFDTLGASATSRAKDLDRHWRNSRTVASHNPTVYKSRIVGDWETNGTEPPYIWHIGVAQSPAKE